MALRHRGTPFSVTLAAATTLFVLLPAAPADPRSPGADSTVLASIRVHNPTAWEGDLPIEVPIGRLATPGLLDWTRVRLVDEDGLEVPFALREGRPHWKSRLVAPIANPRAEDILVFPFEPAPGSWARVDVLPGAPNDRPAASERDGRIVVSYAPIRATIDRSSGMLLRLEAFGEPLLEAPMAVAFRGPSSEGRPRDLGPPRVELASMSSGPAMTELHFVLACGRLTLAVTYRIHASGAVEVLADGRPWEGASPWVDGLVEIELPLAGAAEDLPFLVNRAPYYGFKDFAAAVRHVAAVRRRAGTAVLELGAETANGRRWSRRLFPVRSEQAGRLADLVELVDEGPIVDVSPRTLAVPAAEAVIVHPPEARVAAEVLSRALAACGVAATAVATVGEPPAATFVLRLSGPGEAPGTEGDGFEIRPATGSGDVSIVARMRRLLGDWSSFWLGGAHRGSELAWEAIGRFGWEPTATVNTLRYEWGRRRFGGERGLEFVRLADSYEDLVEIWDLPMLPREWVQLGADARRETAARGRKILGAFRERLEALRGAAGLPDGDAWMLQVRLFGDYFEYHLRRLEILSELQALCAARRSALEGPEGQPAPVRERLLALDAEVHAMAEETDRRMAAVPGAMLARTRAMGLVRPYQEFVNGYDPSLDALLDTKQFAGDLDASPAEVPAGEPFVLRIRMRNEGMAAWRTGAGLRLELGGDTKLLGMPERWEYEGPPLVFGDRREIELRGTAPREPGEGLVRLVFRAPFRSPFALAERAWKIRWK